MYSIIFQTHKVSVILFLLLYLVKTILLLSGKNDLLQKISKTMRVPEMIISTLFLVTGVYMLTQIPEIKPLLIIKIIVVFASIPIAVIGFRKQKKALALLSLIMIIAAYGMAEMAKKSSSVATAPVEETSSSARDIYESKCATCHGEDGSKGLTGATDLSLSQLGNAEIITVISEGRGSMAPFKGSLSDEQIKAVAAYVETLKK